MTSDLISRDMTYAVVKDYFKQKIDRGEYEVDVVDCNADLQVLLFEQPTVDAVEVVMCENCKFWISEIYKDPTLGYCEICDRCTDNDDFCSTGIKMDGGDKA